VFLDSGAVLGTRKLTEFKIDSIAQSWAVISGLASKERAGKALDSMLSELYDGANIKLLTPALRDSLFDPGYIKDYPPGVRENGSQYNHAALWAAQALFEFGDSDNGKKILDLVNPFLRTDSPEKASVYRVEPYVVASDIYTKPSYEGRGGWTWYTGSAGVMYKTILKSLLGFNIKDGALSFSPSLPSAWRGCSITYKRGETTYKIKFEKPEGVFGEVEEVFEDGNLVPDKKIRLDSSKPVSEIRVVLRGKRK
jgi:cellobiose phosphorylase